MKIMNEWNDEEQEPGFHAFIHDDDWINIIIN